jgi:multidrug efflux pump subunit AcrB
MFARFFIERPIFAAVLSIVITLGGGIAVWNLAIAQYPEITPPTVEVSANYPGANSQIVLDTVGAPIEQQVNGVEGMLYMSSQCTNDGTYTLTVTFANGTDLNLAQVLVQNRVTQATPTLPDLVKRRGITVKKKSPSILMIINLSSPDSSRDDLYLSNYATIQLRDELSRINGVGDITYLGQRDYSMRVWLDPNKMRAMNLSARDVVAAVEQQNVQVAAGQLGQPPYESMPKGPFAERKPGSKRDSYRQAFQYNMVTLGRLANADQFKDIVIKHDSQGRLVRLGHVATVERGAQTYDQACTLDGKPSVALSIYQLPGSNALDVARRIRDRMEELKARFPSGVKYDIVYDTTPFIRESITEVFIALRDAIILVAVVVLVFLQSWRSAIIPLVAVPVAVVGTFAVMFAFGFSLNNLTLFGLVLAIGIVVDDAIVVVEAVEHHIEHGLSPREATIKAMEEVSGPVIAIGLVLSAVFIPCVFISGIIGQFFRQFALTIAISTLISAFNSLTLSPALAALLLRDRKEGKSEPLPRLGYMLAGAGLAYYYLTGPLMEWGGLRVDMPYAVWVAVSVVTGLIAGAVMGGVLNQFLAWFFEVFNWAFGVTTKAYTATVAGTLRLSPVVLAVYGVMLYATWHLFTTTPTGFIPQQDKGYLLVNVQLPDAASLDRTSAIMRKAEKLVREVDGVEHTVGISGQSILLGANSSNFGSLYVMLKDFHHRTGEGLTADVIAAQVRRSLRKEISGARVEVFGAPPVEGLGTAGGFKLVIEDRSNQEARALQNVADRTVREAQQDEKLSGASTSFRSDTPWLRLNIDRVAAQQRGISITEVFAALEDYVGAYYINDFNRFGRTWQVNVQAVSSSRMTREGVMRLHVRNEQGQMVPLNQICKPQPTTGPVMLTRYNMYSAALVNVSAAPGYSSGEAIEAMEQAADRALAPGMKREWTELAFLQGQAGYTAMIAFMLAVVLVFLVLAAQYESWSLPLAVILVVPMCLLCAVAGVVMAGLDINIFTQIGFVVLVGLACKNAILIVEFAKMKREQGATAYEATLEACQLRLRPILMTSFAFILGVVPLVLATGAGAEMRYTLGTAVFAGMLGVTLFGIFLTPVFYYVITLLTEVVWPIKPTPTETPATNGHAGPAPSEHLHGTHG